jgi:site-specific DNA-methyltransferase (adenine-specific)
MSTSLAIAENRLLKSLDLARETELQLYERLHDVARDFVLLKEEIANAGFKIKPWVKENLPRSYSWLESHVRLFRDWDKFLQCLKWANEVPYPRHERPSLLVAYDLMDDYDRYEVRLRSRRQDLKPVTQEAVITPLAIQPGTKIALTPTTSVILGEGVPMMRQHIPDCSIAVAVIDVPFYLRAPPELAKTDYYIALNGQRPRFRADWDNFASIQEYEEFCDAWIDEVMRCLNDRGSMSIHGGFTNINIIGRLLQMKGIRINNQIAWAKRNSRPIVCRTRLRHSNESVLWAVKDPKRYRFNYRRCKMFHDPGDSFSARGKQMMDIWDIPTRPGVGHPSPKPIELCERFLHVAGVAGGTVLELFSGAGPAAIAALRWGMKSISIDREPSYLAMLAQRVNEEQSLPELALAAD